MNEVQSINTEQRLYVLSAGEGYISCLGFDVAFERAERIAKHYGVASILPEKHAIGTEQGYAQYIRACAYARSEHSRTGLKCPTELSPQLIGYEGRRVEVVDLYGEKRRFNVGESTGFLPCHLEIHNARASGGPSASREYKSVTVIR